jgi:tetratricopeptide (TPR) repeat protein
VPILNRKMLPKRAWRVALLAVPALAIAAGLAVSRLNERGASGLHTVPTGQLEKKAARGSTDPEVYRELAYRFMEKGEYEEALQRVEQARRLNPSAAENANLEGMIRAEMGQTEAAIECFRQASRLDPNAAEPHLNLGRLAQAHGATSLAAEEFQVAARLAPRDPEPLIHLSLIAKNSGYSARAKSLARKALELDPNNPMAHAALGQIQADFGQPLDARKELQRAIDLGDSSPQTRAYLGLAYAIMPVDPADPDTAIRHLREAERMGERGAQLHYGLGLAYLEKRDYAAAEAALKAGLEGNPSSEGMAYALARVYGQTGRKGKAAEMLRKYGELVAARQTRESLEARLQGQPDRVDLRVQYGDLLLAQGRAADAAGEYRKALELRPGDAKIRAKLGQASRMAAEDSRTGGSRTPMDAAQKTSSLPGRVP